MQYKTNCLKDRSKHFGSNSRCRWIEKNKKLFMHRDAPLPLRPSAPGALTETTQIGSFRLLPRARRLPWKPLIVAPAPRFCYVSAGSGCNVRSTSFCVALQICRVLCRGLFRLSRYICFSEPFEGNKSLCDHEVCICLKDVPYCHLYNPAIKNAKATTLNGFESSRETWVVETIKYI